jgi:hypothetical protein
MKADLARFPKTAPIIVFTHRPLFDLKPEWEWFTSDGDNCPQQCSYRDGYLIDASEVRRGSTSSVPCSNSSS